MKYKKRGKFTAEMIQMTINLPEGAVEDIDKLSKADGLSMNSFTRRWILEGLAKEKTKRDWV